MSESQITSPPPASTKRVKHLRDKLTKKPLSDKTSKTKTKIGGGGVVKTTITTKKKKSKDKKEKPSAGAIVAHKKPYRFHPGRVAVREIRRYQRGTEFLIPKTRFRNVVREVLDECGEFKLQAEALAVLRQAGEMEIVKTFEAGQCEACHAHRQTIRVEDLDTANRVRDILPGRTHSTDEYFSLPELKPPRKMNPLLALGNKKAPRKSARVSEVDDDGKTVEETADDVADLAGVTD
jgi:histone H3